MNPNDSDGHQVGNDLNSQQSNTFTPRVGDAVNAPQTIISSTPDSEDKKENSITRAFGGHSRASQIAAQANSHPSALRQNAPEFFQQSMQQQDVILNAAAEQKAKGKKGLIIGGIIGAIALVAVVIVVVLIAIPNSPSDTDDVKLAEYQTFLENSITTVEKYDQLLTAAEEEAIGLQTGITDEEYEEVKESLNNNLEEIKTLNNSIADNLGLKYGNSETQEQITSLEKELADSLNARLAIYEKYQTVYLALYDVYKSNGSDEAISNFAQVAGDSNYAVAVVSLMRDFYNNRRTFQQTWINNDCNNQQSTPVCASLIDSILVSEQEYNTDTNISKLFASYSEDLGKDPTEIIREIQAIIETEQKNEEL